MHELAQAAEAAALAAWSLSHATKGRDPARTIAAVFACLRRAYEAAAELRRLLAEHGDSFIDNRSEIVTVDGTPGPSYLHVTLGVAGAVLGDVLSAIGQPLANECLDRGHTLDWFAHVWQYDPTKAEWDSPKFRAAVRTAIGETVDAGGFAVRTVSLDALRAGIHLDLSHVMERAHATTLRVNKPKRTARIGDAVLTLPGPLMLDALAALSHGEPVAIDRETVRGLRTRLEKAGQPWSGLAKRIQSAGRGEYLLGG